MFVEITTDENNTHQYTNVERVTKSEDKPRLQLIRQDHTISFFFSSIVDMEINNQEQFENKARNAMKENIDSWNEAMQEVDELIYE